MDVQSIVGGLIGWIGIFMAYWPFRTLRRTSPDIAAWKRGASRMHLGAATVIGIGAGIAMSAKNTVTIASGFGAFIAVGLVLGLYFARFRVVDNHAATNA